MSRHDLKLKTFAILEQAIERGILQGLNWCLKEEGDKLPNWPSDPVHSYAASQEILTKYGEAILDKVMLNLECVVDFER